MLADRAFRCLAPWTNLAGQYAATDDGAPVRESETPRDSEVELHRRSTPVKVCNDRYNMH